MAAVAASPATQRIATDLAEMSGVGPRPSTMRQYKDFGPYLGEHLPGWEKIMEDWQPALCGNFDIMLDHFCFQCPTCAVQCALLCAQADWVLAISY